MTTPTLGLDMDLEQGPKGPLKGEYAVVIAAKALLADVRRRHPGETLRCPYMIALDEALLQAKRSEGGSP